MVVSYQSIFKLTSLTLLHNLSLTHYHQVLATIMLNDYTYIQYYCDRLIQHTKKLLDKGEENLCLKVLQILREMMTVDVGFNDKVKTICNHCFVKLSWFMELN